jgi:pimeloyl-ACP methyl ester carboxylesterase
VISLDLRGHGFSDKPHTTENYGLRTVKNIIYLLDQLNLENIYLIGYSLGGFVALKAATS